MHHEVNMELLRTDNLRALVEHRQWPSISIYLPTHRTGRKEIREDPIRLKNAIAEAKERLHQAGYPRERARELLEPASNLVVNQSFWLYQSDGLAMFASPELFQYYRLPLRFQDEVVVTDHFAIKQLVPIFSEDGRFYVLALSQKQVRFFQATRLGIQEVAVPEMVKSIDDLRQYDAVEEHLQAHTMAITQAATTNLVFHGRGGIADKATYKSDIVQFVRAVARRLEKYLNSSAAPLVLAGVDYEQALYRQENTYHHLMDEGIVGNPEELDQNQLHEAAWEIVEPRFTEARRAILSHYADLSNTERTSDLLETILPAAYRGRVRALFIQTNARVWGRFDPDTGSVTVHDSPAKGDVDLIDLATVYVLEHQGMIYALRKEEMPTESLQAAIFRY
jgi:hypothetical protein